MLVAAKHLYIMEIEKRLFMETLQTQIELISKGLSEHFKDFPISFIFLGFLILVFILNIIKRILIWIEKKHGSLNGTCQYLIVGSKEQDCNNSDYRKYFKENENSCEGCKGKSFAMTDAEAEQRAIKGSLWKCIIFLLANCGRYVLPYISFIYTLVITILNNK